MTNENGQLDFSRLTVRQRSVARLMGVGLTNVEIGKALKISDRTAEIHVRNVLHTIGTTRYRFIYAFAKWGAHE